MKILSKNHSSYPRVGDKPELQKLRRAYNMLDKEKISESEVEKILDDTVSEVIEEQLSSGCDIVTDGQIRSSDPLSYIARKIDGFKITGLLRFFDTNFLYRQPKAVSGLTYKKSLIADDFQFLRGQVETKSSSVMIGPYSLLKMSIVNGDFEDCLANLADIYLKELIELKSKGAGLIQLDEPAILHNPDDIGLFKSVYDKIAAYDSRPEILIGLYFGNATSLLAKLNELPVDGYCFDFTYSPGLIDSLDGFSKNIGLGIIDARNTKMEILAEVASKADAILNNLKSAKVYITTSCGLEFLPRNRAFDKLNLCADVAKALTGGAK
ncbi:MAG: hypothetical protein GY839_00970 [candidate division Zixibacteria bacterium]|nr:hypothetical protein [candidate division Zixibacteria bacterium]